MDSKTRSQIATALRAAAQKLSGDTTDSRIEAAENAFPKAGKLVDGREVRSKVDNTSSISSSFNDYYILKGIREIPLSLFPVSGYAAVDDRDRVSRLAGAIRESGEISPLIVVVDKEGVGSPYVLEGGHRLSALQMLGAKALPALVVVDLDDTWIHDFAARRDSTTKLSGSQPPLTGFDFFDVEDVPEAPLTGSRKVFREMKRGDVVSVGRTKWVVMNVIGGMQAHVFKHPSRHTKLYELRAESHDSDDHVVVFQVDGSGSRVGEDVASGPLRATGESVSL